MGGRDKNFVVFGALKPRYYKNKISQSEALIDAGHIQAINRLNISKTGNRNVSLTQEMEISCTQ